MCWYYDLLSQLFLLDMPECSFRAEDKGVTLSSCSCVGVDNELPDAESLSLSEVVSQIL